MVNITTAKFPLQSLIIKQMTWLLSPINCTYIYALNEQSDHHLNSFVFDTKK